MAKTLKGLGSVSSGRRWPATTSVAAAVFMALHGAPRTALADQGR